MTLYVVLGISVALLGLATFWWRAYCFRRWRAGHIDLHRHTAFDLDQRKHKEIEAWKNW